MDSNIRSRARHWAMMISGLGLVGAALRRRAVPLQVG